MDISNLLTREAIADIVRNIIWWRVPDTDIASPAEEEARLAIQNSRPKWPIDVQAVHDELAALGLEPKSAPDKEYERRLDELWDKYWPEGLEWTKETAIEWKIKHFGLKCIDTPEERDRIVQLLTEYPFPDAEEEEEEAAKLPPVPQAVRHTDLPFVCGWPVTVEWMRMFAQKSKEKDPTIYLHPDTTPDFYSAICQRSGYGGSFYSIGVYPETPVLDNDLGNMFYGKLPITGVLGISRTSSKDEYEHIPTHSELEWLKKVFSGEPSWFRHPFSLEDFDE
ncbi:hypothetical protein ONZ51_g13204 [Trametes cubensis]|uniref:Uncharacterized protein n=1 Tax=Trametes cubensis TaxID=1111947 RepID=A0AAD7X4T9_9APHY|nr:hypothetical protein ONZ51_g13204 [Trametes cubensis]